MSHQKPDDATLRNRYGYHAPVGDQAGRYCQVREAILTAAKTCRDLTPCCPEQSRAFNALDDAMFLFNAAIARSEGSPVAEGPTATRHANVTGLKLVAPGGSLGSEETTVKLNRLEVSVIYADPAVLPAGCPLTLDGRAVTPTALVIDYGHRPRSLRVEFKEGPAGTRTAGVPVAADFFTVAESPSGSADNPAPARLPRYPADNRPLLPADETRDPEEPLPGVTR